MNYIVLSQIGQTPFEAFAYRKYIIINLSVLKLEKRNLHQNGVELHQKFIGNQISGATRQKYYPRLD